MKQSLFFLFLFFFFLGLKQRWVSTVCLLINGKYKENHRYYRFLGQDFFFFLKHGQDFCIEIAYGFAKINKGYKHAQSEYCLLNWLIWTFQDNILVNYISTTVKVIYIPESAVLRLRWLHLEHLAFAMLKTIQETCGYNMRYRSTFNLHSIKKKKEIKQVEINSNILIYTVPRSHNCSN